VGGGGTISYNRKSGDNFILGEKLLMYLQASTAALWERGTRVETKGLK